VKKHPDIQIRKLRIGQENAPLLVIDNLLADADQLVDLAATKIFGDVDSYYPGVRAKTPLTYKQCLLEQLSAELIAHFKLGVSALRFTACHFSLVTTQPEKLAHLQRIPHIDSVASDELALIHYLFKADMGGTAFYRHRNTGFEVIDANRKLEYFNRVEVERDGPDSPAHAYINGDTPLYEQIDKQDGVFNRLLVYRRNSLHSGCIGPDFVATTDPRKGRLSINGFLA
jgi:Family of unknown function (DUF6445)